MKIGCGVCEECMECGVCEECVVTHLSSQIKSKDAQIEELKKQLVQQEKQLAQWEKQLAQWKKVAKTAVCEAAASKAKVVNQLREIHSVYSGRKYIMRYY